MNVIYYFACGCTSTPDKIKKFSVEGAMRYACPEHRETVEYRTMECQDPDCADVFEISAIGQIPKYCVPCRKKKGIKLSHKHYKFERDLEKTPAALKTAIRSDCLHHYNCLTDAAMRNLKRLPCLNCERYVKKERNYAPMSCRRFEGEAVYALHN